MPDPRVNDPSLTSAEVSLTSTEPEMLRIRPGLTPPRPGRYAGPVVANSTTGIGIPKNTRRTGATIRIGAFFMPSTSYGGLCEGSSGSAGFLVCRYANLVQSVTPTRLVSGGDGSNLNTRNLS